MNTPDDPWKKLVQATKSNELESDTTSAPVPELSVSNLRERVHRLMLTLTWRKCSLLAAIGAGLIYLAIYLNTRDDHSTPAIQIESPSTPSTSTAP